jgi:RNA polymerase sigma-70 factor (sigma-E family)
VSRRPGLVRRRHPAHSAEVIGGRIADALWAACHPPATHGPSVPGMGAAGLLVMSGAVPLRAPVRERTATQASHDVEVDALIERLFEEEGRPLVRLVRLFVDDRNAAEDLVQEGFIKLSRHADRINDPSKAASYLRSIVLNLARDHNRRGLVSLRHHLPLDEQRAASEDELALREDQREVIDALRELPYRQRDCLVLRYYEGLGIDEIADCLDISRNSVKTHLSRGLASLERHLGSDIGAEQAGVGP